MNDDKSGILGFDKYFMEINYFKIIENLSRWK